MRKDYSKCARLAKKMVIQASTFIGSDLRKHRRREYLTEIEHRERKPGSNLGLLSFAVVILLASLWFEEWERPHAQIRLAHFTLTLTAIAILLWLSPSARRETEGSMGTLVASAEEHPEIIQKQETLTEPSLSKNDVPFPTTLVTESSNVQSVATGASLPRNDTEAKANTQITTPVEGEITAVVSTRTLPTPTPAIVAVDPVPRNDQRYGAVDSQISNLIGGEILVCWAESWTLAIASYWEPAQISKSSKRKRTGLGGDVPVGGGGTSRAEYCWQ